MKHSDMQDATLAVNDVSGNAPEWIWASKHEELTRVTRETVKQSKKSGT